MLPDMPTLSDAGVPLSAWICRGLAVPVETPADVIQPLAAALRTTAGDAEFREQAEQMGVVADWRDGPAWTARMRREGEELAALWAADPWLNAAGQ